MSLEGYVPYLLGFILTLKILLLFLENLKILKEIKLIYIIFLFFWLSYVVIGLLDNITINLLSKYKYIT